jgi:hypothetical protein
MKTLYVQSGRAAIKTGRVHFLTGHHYATGVLGAEEALLSSWGYRQDHLIDRRWQSKGRQGPEEELEECGLPAFIFGSSWFGFKFGLGFRDRFA